MSIRHRSHDPSPNRTVQQPASATAAADSTSKAPPARTSAGLGATLLAAATLVVLIVFMLQNTRSVAVSFLWMHGTVPLAMALLIAGVGTAVLALSVAAVRTTLRRRRTRDR